MTKILLTGATGQVGWELARALLPLGEVVIPPRAECDLSRPQLLGRLVDAVQPDVIVNAAAYTAVDKAEEETALAMAVNADAPGALAQAARRHGALLVHYSTDYVFDGRGDQFFDEDDTPHPLGTYGRSKLAGENAVRESLCDSLIFRTSWVYAARGKNFLRTMLRLAAERDELRVVADQFGAPTWARLIAETTALALKQDIGLHQEGRFASELMHLAASGVTTWHGFASEIIKEAGRNGATLKCRAIVPITTAEYPLPASRPANSRLSCTRLEQRYGITMPRWDICLARMMEEAD